MNKMLIAPLAALAIATSAGLALATDDSPRANVPQDQWLTMAELADKLAAQGYTIREIEVDDGAYKASVLDKDGNRVRAVLHPATGEILSRRSDDDRGRHDRRRTTTATTGATTTATTGATTTATTGVTADDRRRRPSHLRRRHAAGHGPSRRGGIRRHGHRENLVKAMFTGRKRP